MLNLKPERFGLLDYAVQRISICGKMFVADRSGALYWPAEKALIVADLHFEKGSSYAARGCMLPPYDTRETLIRLAAAIDRHDVQLVIALGDSFHDDGAAARLSAADRQILTLMQDHCRWIWITGNHDPTAGGLPGAQAVPELTIAGLTLRHTPATGRVTHEIAGHMHPAARLWVYGTSIRRPCFVSNGLRLILPAFGAYTGGLNVLHDEFSPLFSDDGLSVWMLGDAGLYPVAPRQLRSD